MNIELKPIAESKVRQLGGDVCGVLVRTEDSEVMAVSEHGRCTRLDGGVMEPVDPAGMSDREQFEKRFPVPLGVKWCERQQDYTYENYRALDSAASYSGKWQAWQAARAQSGQGAEPVAEFWKSHHYASQNHISWLVDIDDLPDDSLLYTQPQPAQQGCVPEGWRECLIEMVQAMHDYEMSVDEDAPYKHRAMMDRAHTLLSTPATPQADGCEWHTDGNGCWMGACGKEFWFEDGGPSDNGMKYCLSCGKPCVEVGDPDEQSGGQDNAL